MTKEEAINEIKSWDFLEGKEIEAIQTLIPELRESEDERTRKEIIEFIQWCEDRSFTHHDFHQAKRPSEWIAYLEKQKEHQNESDAHEKVLGRDLTFPQGKDKNLDEIAQEYVDTVKVYNPEPTWDLMQTAVCYGYYYCEEKNDSSASGGELLYTADKSYEIGYRDGKMDAQKEQKPEENSVYPHSLDEAIQLYYYTYGNGKGGFDYLSLPKFQDIVEDFVKSYGQKPAEWSEEDEKMLNRIIHNLDDLGYEEFCLSSRDQDAPEDRLYFEEIEWLKDLRHKIKQDVPSIIVDENCFKVHINCVDAYNELHDYLSGLFRQYVECKTLITKDNIDADLSMMYPYMEKYVASVIGNCSPLDDHAFRSFYSAGYKEGKAEHWKPTKAQLNALSDVIYPCDDVDKYPLETLYFDLKKL